MQQRRETGRGSPPPAAPSLVGLSRTPIAPADRRAPVDRNAERRVVLTGLVGTALFLVAALVAWLTAIAGPGRWAPLHLALAGGAGMAIGALLPHFTVSLAVARPAPAAWRYAGLGCLAVGAATAVVGVSALGFTIGALGALLYVLGIGITAATAFLPARAAIGRRGGIVELGYGLALVEVAASVGLAALYLVGVPAVVADWAWLKPAHAWLNLIGFLGLTVAVTLVHLYPTAIGSRIRPRPMLALMVGGLAAGPAVVALGYVLRAAAIASLGAALAALGAMALLVVALEHWRRRGRWTTELGWHRLVIGHLSGAVAWLAIGVVVAAAAVAGAGIDPLGWSVDRLIGPVVVGCAVQALVGSWSHLLPAVGPGDQARHAAQRAILSRWWAPRLAAMNLAALLLTAGALLSSPPLVAGGAVCATLALGIALALLFLAALRR